MITITVKYSCGLCRLEKIELLVPARENESIDQWLQETIQRIADDHAKRSKGCFPDHLKDIMIPVYNENQIGGPELQ